MHMADALLSPAVGGVMTAVSAGAVGYSVKKLSGDRLDEKKIPVMGVMGAFVFAAQMINFTIPGTGSSGHIGGGILLAALLGPFPALITLASVLLIQCLLFADGGLLAYGCNVFNIAVCACLIAYPVIFKPIVRHGASRRRIAVASVLAVVAGLQLGAFCVVLQTVFSGVTELPFAAFTALMQPIHLAIGLAEGIVTAFALCFMQAARPELLDASGGVDESAKSGVPLKKILIVILVLAVVIGGGLSLYASNLPDGLEWSILNITGTDELERDSAAHNAIGGVVDSTAIMPDYSFAGDDDASKLGTATAGLVGSTVTIALAAGIGFVIHAARKNRVKKSAAG